MIDLSGGGKVPAPRNGPLPLTTLTDVRLVEGGWAGRIIGEPGVYTYEKYLAAIPLLASALQMKPHMISLLPDEHDDNNCEIYAQRQSPLASEVFWPGPDSVDGPAGTAPIARYMDGTWATFRLYVPGWGCHHLFTCGTTGAGKSDFLCELLAIDRHAWFLDPATGRPRGMVGSLLIDPSQGQSFAPYVDDLAAPVAVDIDEALLMVEALNREALRRNRWLANEATWIDKQGRPRRGRKWWNPLTDGPLLTLTIDEAHRFLKVSPRFLQEVEAGGRMWRKTGLQLRIGTQTALLDDLGGSNALRSMITGGMAVVFRTADALSGPIAFNGTLPADPRTIPRVPGTCYVLDGDNPRAMLARSGWLDDWYDAVRDPTDQPIGHPVTLATLPSETLDAFGPDFAAWAKWRAADDGTLFTPPSQHLPGPTSITVAAGGSTTSAKCVDAVELALTNAYRKGAPVMDMDALDEALRAAGTPYRTRTVRDALAELIRENKVTKDSTDRSNPRFELSPDAKQAVSPPTDRELVAA